MSIAFVTANGIESLSESRFNPIIKTQLPIYHSVGVCYAMALCIIYCNLSLAIPLVVLVLTNLSDTAQLILSLNLFHLVTRINVLPSTFI